MTPEEVAEWRHRHEITVTGANVPNPVRTFEEASVPEFMLKEILKAGFTEPTAIQSQGWPMAMSGRNMVGIAQTGSGKTLSFILPALLHIAAQPAAMSPARARKREPDNPRERLLSALREAGQQAGRDFDAVRDRHSIDHGRRAGRPECRDTTREAGCGCQRLHRTRVDRECGIDEDNALRRVHVLGQNDLANLVGAKAVLLVRVNDQIIRERDGERHIS